jgi:hypothetical protein
MLATIRSGIRLGTLILAFGLLPGTLLADPPTSAAPITKGQRVFFAGHSFQYFVPPILDDIARLAGIQDHVSVGLSYLGGSRVIQHWDLPEGSNKIKDALRSGKVDVLALAPLYLPDDGIDKFTKLALQYNPAIRITVQDIWLRWDVYEPGCKKLPPDKTDHNAITAAELWKRSTPLFKSIDDYVQQSNKRLGKTVLFVMPAGQAVIGLREKIIAGKAPGLKSQEDIFLDTGGHGKPPLEALVSYCYFSVIYRRSPVGLPMPQVLAKANNPNWDAELNRLLQEVAWQAVIQNPLSGVRSGGTP